VVCQTCHGTGLQAGTASSNYNQTQCETCNGTGKVQPETPDELLTDEEILEATRVGKIRADGSYDAEGYLTGRQQVAKAQLLKCHQSEAAIRADQNKKIGEWLDKHDRARGYLNSVVVSRQDIDQLKSGSMPQDKGKEG
jgi:excinuclease UvrABC ATPase subunit